MNKIKYLIFPLAIAIPFTVFGYVESAFSNKFLLLFTLGWWIVAAGGFLYILGLNKIIMWAYPIAGFVAIFNGQLLPGITALILATIIALFATVYKQPDWLDEHSRFSKAITDDMNELFNEVRAARAKRAFYDEKFEEFNDRIVDNYNRSRKAYHLADRAIAILFKEENVT